MGVPSIQGVWKSCCTENGSTKNPTCRVRNTKPPTEKESRQPLTHRGDEKKSRREGHFSSREETNSSAGVDLYTYLT